MRRFVAILTVLFLVMVGFYYSYFHAGFYFGNDDQPVSAFSYAAGKEIYVNEEKTDIRCVDLSASLPGKNYMDFSMKKEDYLECFSLIEDLGANAVRVSSIMDQDFYDSFYEYNQTKGKLYLIQGISFSDAIRKSVRDGYDSGLYDELISTGKTAIDIIHGKRDIFNFARGEYGFFRKDLSDLVLGFELLGGFDPDMVSYTDHRLVKAKTSRRNYVYPSQDASVFETLLCDVMDELFSYEGNKYGTQRLIGVQIDKGTDLVHYEEVYERQLSKYAYIDPQHIQTTETNKAGFYVDYHLSMTMMDHDIDPSTQKAYKVLEDLNESYSSYCEMLGRYHTMPLIATFSATSGFLADNVNDEANDETMQGQELVNTYKTVKNCGFAGAAVSSLQDIYSASSFNTAFATDTSNAYLWHELLSEGQNSGLLAFEAESSHFADGDGSEWKAEDLVIDAEKKVYLSYDYEGLHIFVKGAKESDLLYLPIDTNDSLGARKANVCPFGFDRAADFILKIHGTDDTILYVQERQDATRENFRYEMEGENAFSDVPAADTNQFVIVNFALNNPYLTDKIDPQSRALQRMGKQEVGRLIRGNGNPYDANYDSLSSFCFGEDGVEVLIPWLMLNVGDPCNMRIHQDYYRNYGVDFKKIDKIYIGLSSDARVIELKPFSVKGWGDVKYVMRTKKSYEVLGNVWRAE